MTRRRILILLATIALIVVGGLFIAAALIPEDRVAAAIAARAESALGEPVDIEGVGIAIFPTPGVRLDGIAVGAGDTARLARVERAEVRVRVLPLFRGQVVVRSFELDRPEITVLLDAEGVTNFPVIQPDTSAPSGAPARDIAFAVDRIRITDGRIAYRNEADGTRVEMTGWNQELSVRGQLEGGELASLRLDGWLSLDDIAADLPGAVLPTRDLALRVEHDAALDLTADRLDLETLMVSFDGVDVRGSGRVTGLNSGRPDVDLELGAEGLDAGRLMAWVPDSLLAMMALPDGRAVGLRGGASFSATVRGTVAPDTLPAVNGQLGLQDVAVTVGSAAVLESVTGDVQFSLDSVVARFNGQLLEERFNAGAAVRNPSSPVAVVAFSGGGDLGRLAGLGLVPDTLGLGGTVSVDLRAQVPADNPAGALAFGTVDARSVVVSGLDPEVRVPTAVTRFDGGTVTVDPLRIELGPERAGIDLTLTADGWIEAAADSGAAPPRITVAMEADTLDLDALLGPSESGYPPLLFARLRELPIDGRPPEDVARDMGLAVPPLPPVDATIRARIARLVRNGLAYSDMDARVRVTEAAAVLEEVRFGLMGGQVTASGRLEPLRTDSNGAPVETRVAGRFELANVGAGPFFDRLTPFRDHLDGRLAMTGGTEMTLDEVALPLRQSLQAEGSMAISDGRLANWAVLQNVTGRLGITAFDTLRFRDWQGGFRIDGPRVNLDETALAGIGLDARTSGWFDFGGRIDMTATVALSPDLARRAGAIGQQILSAVPGGQVPVGLRIRGLVEDPDVDLDLGPARQAVAGRARQAVEDAAEDVQQRVDSAAAEARRRAEAAAREAAREAEEEARRRVQEGVDEAADQATEEVARRIELPDSLRELPADSLRKILGDSAFALLPDSVRARADSLQQALENAIRERLRRLLPGGGGGGR